MKKPRKPLIGVKNCIKLLKYVVLCDNLLICVKKCNYLQLSLQIIY
jgi:hypothetical protein